jgi:four helix bundle protein
MSNLAEGSGRTSVRDQAHFSQIAYGSLLEVDAQPQLSHELAFFPKPTIQKPDKQSSIWLKKYRLYVLLN